MVQSEEKCVFEKERGDSHWSRAECRASAVSHIKQIKFSPALSLLTDSESEIARGPRYLLLGVKLVVKLDEVQIQTQTVDKFIDGTVKVVK